MINLAFEMSFLKSTIRLKKAPSHFLRRRHPWVYQSEIDPSSISKDINPGSWVLLENHDGQVLGYGYFNPHSVLSFRVFERTKFKTEEQTRALFFKRCDAAFEQRMGYFSERISNAEMGRYSFRLLFGESDLVPGLVVDLFEDQKSSTSKGTAVIQSHAAGADTFILWMQQWLDERLGITSGVIRNDSDVRKKEKVKQEVLTWGNAPEKAQVLEGGVRFWVDLKAGQKTGFFYDHRDHRRLWSVKLANLEGNILDCFSYTGSWGLQALKRNKNLSLLATDVSEDALSLLIENAKLNGLNDRVEI